MKHPLIIDGHNDTVLRFYKDKVLGLPVKSFFERSDEGHIDYPRAIEGGLGGGFFAIYSPNEIKPPDKEMKMPGDGDDDSAELSYKFPLPPMLEQPYSLGLTIGMMSMLFDWERESDGRVKIVRTVADMQHCLDNGILGIIIHIEGAESIDADLETLHVFHQAGLRSIGPVWSRPTIFAHGVPFNFPDTPDIGSGLTDQGKAFVKTCNELGIMLDMSHLNMKGFYDIASISDAPLVCTHSNAHACCPSPRNLVDAQLDEIKRTNGVTGINYHKGFLRQDGKAHLETSLTEMVRHAAYIADRIGVDHVVLGSDFDGALMPEDLGTVLGQPALLDAMSAHGFNNDEIAKIAHGNWMRVLKNTWK